tara:strand:- start:87 stop:725 length:639 start_codon:yes stop_codon:yes gene_type:complete
MVVNRVFEFISGAVIKLVDDYYDMNTQVSKNLVLIFQVLLILPIVYWVTRGNDYIFVLFALIVGCYLSKKIDTNYYKVISILTLSLIIVLVLSQGPLNFINSVDPFLLFVSLMFLIVICLESKYFKEEFSMNKIFVRFMCLVASIALYYNKEIIKIVTEIPIFNRIFNSLMTLKPLNYMMDKVNLPVALSSYVVAMGYFSTNVINMYIKMNK